MIVIDRERHELIEGHIALGIDLMQLGRHGCELEALARRRRSDAEMLGDGLVALLLSLRRIARNSSSGCSGSRP